MEKAKENFQKCLDVITASLTDSGIRPKLLLHSCCAPCSSYVLEYLVKFFDVTVFYYNPNISPADEYYKRAQEQERFCRESGLGGIGDVIVAKYGSEEFYSAVAGLEKEPEGGARCGVCFRLRLGKTAALAKEMGFEYFCTTLTVSPHKNAAVINKIGEALAEKYGLKWLPSDFKKKEGYKRSLELSRKFSLYRQNWCGCEFSKKE